MEGLGTPSLSVFDATEFGLGVDVLGPRIGGANSVVRAGIATARCPSA